MQNKKYEDQLTRIYGDAATYLQPQTARYRAVHTGFEKQFGGSPQYFCSAPGRVEIIGNHTDHNGGRVVAAAINLDTIAAAVANGSETIRLFSENYTSNLVEVNLRDLAVKATERNSTPALLRGIAARFVRLEYQIGGFDAYVSSEVGVGSGLSSSAAFEVLIGTIFNALFNAGRIPAVEIAQIGQFAENEYFGKPCGLMDQLASAVGGMVMIDFKDRTRPEYEKIQIDLQAQNYILLTVDIQDSHADLTPDYAAIPQEMRMVCREFGVQQCREINLKDFYSKIAELRQKVGDRAILRCAHFFAENERVTQVKSALQSDDFASFLDLINASGLSSLCWLENCYPPHRPATQGVNLGLLLTKEYFNKHNISGACRVHGGGFAGSIIVFLPAENLSDYRKYIEKIFGAGAVKALRIRPVGTTYFKMNSK